MEINKACNIFTKVFSWNTTIRETRSPSSMETESNFQSAGMCRFSAFQILSTFGRYYKITKYRKNRSAHSMELESFLYNLERNAAIIRRQKRDHQLREIWAGNGECSENGWRTNVTWSEQIFMDPKLVVNVLLHFAWLPRFFRLFRESLYRLRNSVSKGEWKRIQMEDDNSAFFQKRFLSSMALVEPVSGKHRINFHESIPI